MKKIDKYKEYWEDIVLLFGVFMSLCLMVFQGLFVIEEHYAGKFKKIFAKFRRTGRSSIDPSA